MKKILFLFLFITITIFSYEVKAADLKPEQERPKIGLCLSGGGAKGLAYIGLLKLIDSLDIKIDYITGTSMGSIIGGLYAIGYTGKQLEVIALTTDWGKYLSNNVPLSKISMEEKDEYGRYMVELKSNNLLPGLPMGVIDGQNIMSLLNDLTFRVQQISDFNKFPIPFQCLAVDIVTGQPVVINKGSLALAMRTSMSIPTAFTPVDTGQMLLVDGGLFKNFPVEYVKNMGADFVIGANSSGVLLKKKQIKTLMNMLEQTTSFSIAADYEKQKKLCDLLVDYNAELINTNIGTTDFGKSKQILEIGERVAHEHLKELIELSNNQHQYFLSKTDTSHLNRSDSLQSFELKLTLDKSSLGAIVKNKTRLKDYNNISKTEISKTVDAIYGTQYFDKVYYYVENKDGQHNLVIKTEKTKKFAYKLGIHYDNEMSAGIIANITARNFLFDASRFIGSIDISDNPKARLGYQVYVGGKGLYLSTNHFFERVKQPAFYQQQVLGIYKNLYLQSDVLVNYAINENAALSGGIQMKWGNLKPENNPSDQAELFRSTFTLTRRPYLNSSLVMKYGFNTMNKPVFATRGINVMVQAEMVFAGKTSTSLHTETIEVDSFLSLHTIPSDTILGYKFSPYLKLYWKYDHVYRLHRKLSLNTRVDLGMIFLFKPSKTDFAIQQSDAFYIGGVEQRERERTSSIIPFWGNRELYIQNLNFLTASVSLQYEAIKNLFFIPKFSVFTGDHGSTGFYGGKGVISDFKNYRLQFVHSEGMTVAYRTPVGPVQLNLSKASNSKKLVFYFSLGYRF